MERILNPATETSEKPEIFLAYGIQENNIVALWESIATNYDVYDSYGKLQDLIDIFQYFLISLLSSSQETRSLCWEETTTASTLFTLPFSYSTVT